MRKRWLHILVLVWQAVWLLLIVPGHTRGQILVPGTPLPVESQADGAQLRAAASCCAVTSVPTSSDEDQPVPQERARRCAVCHLVARMSTAVAVVLYVPKPTLAEVLPVQLPATPHVVADVRVSFDRGPPPLGCIGLSLRSSLFPYISCANETASRSWSCSWSSASSHC